MPATNKGQHKILFAGDSGGSVFSIEMNCSRRVWTAADESGRLAFKVFLIYIRHASRYSSEVTSSVQSFSMFLPECMGWS